MGFTEVKKKVLLALLSGNYEHETRSGLIDEKNQLATGQVTAAFVSNIVKRCTGSDYESSPHHKAPSVTVHVIRKNNWYVKFYFLVQRFINELTNEIDGFVRQLRRKPRP